MWSVPGVYALSAIVSAAVLPRLEIWFLPSLISPISVPSAVAMYSAIAAGMMALTAIVFSVYSLAVHFAASAWAPRLASRLARDSVLAHSLGIFIATFLFALVALVSMDASALRASLISAAVMLGLVLTSAGFFVALLQRVGRFQVNRLLTFIGDRGREAIDALYPSLDSVPSSTNAAAPDPVSLAPSQIRSYRGRPLAVQAIRVDALLYLARRSGGVVDVRAAVGDTVLESTPLVHVYQTRAFIEEHLLRDAFEFGEERTFKQDPTYAFRLLVDIALKAMSPAVNDPTTAVQAIDQIGDLLLRLSRRRLDVGTFYDVEGQRRVVIPVPAWDDFLRLAFDEIGRHGATSAPVLRRLSALVDDLEAAVPLIDRRDAVQRCRKSLDASIRSVA